MRRLPFGGIMMNLMMYVGPVHHGCLALCLSCPWSKFNLQDYFN